MPNEGVQGSVILAVGIPPSCSGTDQAGVNATAEEAAAEWLESSGGGKRVNEENSEGVVAQRDISDAEPQHCPGFSLRGLLGSHVVQYVLYVRERSNIEQRARCCNRCEKLTLDFSHSW